MAEGANYPAAVTFTPRGIDEVRTQIANLRAEMAKLRKQSDDNSKSPLPQSTEKLGKEFAKLSALIDPAVAGQQKLAKAQDILSESLKRGIITQQQHNDALDKAKAKFSDVASFTEKLGATVGKAVENGLSEIPSKLSGITELISKFGGEAGKAFEEFSSKASSSVSGLASITAELGPLAIAAAAVVAIFLAFSAGIVVVDWLKDIVQEGMKTQDVVEGLNQSLRTNGSASGESAEELIKYADSLSVATGKSKESIVQAEAQLTKFPRLGENLRIITSLSLDYAQAQTLATGHEVSAAEAAAKLGPVYEGKAKALQKLSDIGIVLDTGQRKYLQSLIDTGKIEEYQAQITELLTKKVDGLAAAHAETLAGAIDKAQNAYKLAREDMASELIPAIQDVFKAVVDSAGGWDYITEVVRNDAEIIGYIVKNLVYGVGISFLELERRHDTLGIYVTESLAKLIDAYSSFMGFFGKIPIPNNPFKDISDFAGSAAKALHNSAGQFAIDAAKESLAIVQLTADMQANKKALEGSSDKPPLPQAPEIERLTKTTKELKDGIDAEQNSLDKLKASFEAMKLKLIDQINDRTRLIAAMQMSDAAYKAEQANIAAEKSVRADLAELMKGHEEAVKTANKAIDESTKNFGANSAQVTEANRILREIDKTYDDSVAGLKQLEESNKRSAESFKNNEQSVVDFKKALAEANKASEESIKWTLQIQQARASLSDEQTRIDLESRYGSAVADLAVKLDYATEATRKYNIEAQLEAEIKAHKEILNQQEVDDMRAEIAARYDEIQSFKTAKEELQIKADIWKPLSDGFIPVSGIILDGIRSWKGNAADVAESIAKSLVDWLEQAFEQIIQNWIKTQITMLAIQKSYQAQYGVFNTGTTALDTASGSGSGLSSLSSGSGSGASAGTIAGYALAAYAVFVAWKVLVENLHTWSGEATIASGGAVADLRSMGSYARAAGEVITTLITQVNDLAKTWHLDLMSLTAGSVSINLTSDGAIIVKTLVDGVGRIFKNMSDAMDYAKVQALKFASYGAGISDLVKNAIARSQATTTAGLQADIDFASRLATQNLPQIGQQLHTLLQNMVDDFRHAFDLFGPLTSGLRSLADLSQLGPATASVLTSFSTSLQTLYDELTGHKEDAKEVAEMKRQAFNAERAIMIAQIVLLIETTKARIAEYVAGQLALTNFRNRQQPTGDGSDPTDGLRTGGGTTSISEKGGGVLHVDVRNPTGDAGLAALLQVLDNLTRALAGLPPEIGAGGVVSGTGGGGHGSGAGGGVDSLRSLIDASDKQWNQRGMSDVGKQIDDINDKYNKAIADTRVNSNTAAKAEKERADAIKAAGKLDEDHRNAAIKAANDKYNHEISGIHKTQQAINDANVAREHEIQLAKDAAAKNLEDRLKSYEDGAKDTSSPQGALQSILDDGQKVRDDFLKTAADLGYTADQISAGLARIQIAEEKREQALIKNVIGGLGLPLEGTRDQVTKVGDAVAFLKSEADKGKISAERLADVLEQVGEQGRLQLLGIGSGLLEQMGQFDGADKLKREMDEVNFHIQRAQFNALLDMYETSGVIFGAVRDHLETLRNDINDPLKWPDFNLPTPTRGGQSEAQSQASQAQTQADSVNTFKSAVDKFNSATDALLQSYQSLFTDATLGGSAADRLSTAQQGFQLIERAALSGDVDARSKFGQQATDYLKTLFDTTGGGAYYYSELARIKSEFQTLFAQTRFSVDGVTYDNRLGAPVSPASPISPASSGGYGQVANDNNNNVVTSGQQSSSDNSVVVAAIVHLESSLIDITNTIANNTGGNSRQLTTLIADLERLIPYLKQLVA